MPTTTIRLSEDLKERIARVAERAGTTSHAFILSAIADKAEHAERQTEFEDVAEQRFASIIETGKTISWTEMQSYLNKRVAGRKTAKPVARKLR